MKQKKDTNTVSIALQIREAFLAPIPSFVYRQDGHELSRLVRRMKFKHLLYVQTEPILADGAQKSKDFFQSEIFAAFLGGVRVDDRGLGG